MPLPPNNTRHRSRWLGAVCSFQSKRGAAAKYPSNHIIRRWVDGRFYMSTYLLLVSRHALTEVVGA